MSRENLIAELNNVLNMSEDDVCKAYNADSKAGIIEILEEEIEALRSDEEELEEGNKGLDPAFSSWYEVNSMFI